MATDDEYTPREIKNALERLEQAIKDLRVEVSTLGFVRQDVWSEAREAMNERIEQVRAVAASDHDDAMQAIQGTQENLRWLARAVVGIVLTAILTGLLAANGAVP